MRFLPRFEAVYQLWSPHPLPDGNRLQGNASDPSGGVNWSELVVVQEQPEDWAAFSGADVWSPPASGEVVWRVTIDDSGRSAGEHPWLAVPTLALWNEAVTDVVAAIGKVAPAPTFLPRLSSTLVDPSNLPPFRWTFRLTDRNPGSAVIDPDKDLMKESLFVEPRMEPQRWALRDKGFQGYQVQVEFPGLYSHEGVPLRGASQAISALPFSSAYEPDQPIGLRFHLSVPDQSLVNLSTTRIGALDLGFRSATPDLTISGGQVGSGAAPTCTLNAKFTGVTVAPADVDLSEFEQSSLDADRPIVLGGRAGGATATVVVAESVNVVDRRTRDRLPHTLLLNLILTGVAGDPAPIVVVASRPFMVGGVIVSFPASVDSSEFASWSLLDGGRWLIKCAQPRQSMILPPQIIGEEMERLRTPAAAVPGEGNLGYPTGNDVFESVPVASRFAPLASIDFDVARAEGEFGDLPWNLSRVFGYVAGAASGVALRAAQFELLYGLAASFAESDPSRPRTRIAEIGTLYGALPVTIDRPTQYGDAWNELRDTVSARLAILRVWRPMDEQPLHLSDGVAFRLRDSADLRWPIAGDSEIPPELQQAKLRGTGPPQPSVVPAASGGPFIGSPDRSEGLAGGVGWMFESRNILTSTWRQRTANGGDVDRLHFSALGGLGVQTALFDNRRTIITSDNHLTPGRNQRLTLIRVGRIARFWNRARHVVVYERSVVPPAQFYNGAPIGHTQDELPGRAVLRKVAEYIELNQATRTYPDLGGSQASAGCVVGATFITKKINVDSRWGFDVRDEGWAIKLWDPAFAAAGPVPGQDPDDSPAAIYAKPHIVLNVMGRDGSVTAREIDNPEVLRFFSSTRSEDTDDTDAWASVRDIDYDDAPAPRTPNWMADATPATPPNQPTDATFPSPKDTPIGMNLGTFKLVPNAAEAALAHGRMTGGISAKLNTVTLARASPRPSAQTAGFHVDHATPILSFAEYCRHLHEQLFAISSQAGAVGKNAAATLLRLKAHVQQIDPGILEKLAREIPQAVVPPNLAAQLSGEVSRALDQRLNTVAQWTEQLENNLGAALNRLLATTDPTLDGLKNAIRADLGQIQMLSAAARGTAVSLGGAVEQVLATVGADSSALSDTLRAPAGRFADASDSVMRVLDRDGSVITTTFTQVNNLVSAIDPTAIKSAQGYSQNQSATYQKEVTDQQKAIRDALAIASSAFVAFLAAIDKSSCRTNGAAAISGLNQAILGVPTNLPRPDLPINGTLPEPPPDPFSRIRDALASILTLLTDFISLGLRLLVWSFGPNSTSLNVRDIGNAFLSGGDNPLTLAAQLRSILQNSQQTLLASLQAPQGALATVAMQLASKLEYAPTTFTPTQADFIQSIGTFTANMAGALNNFEQAVLNQTPVTQAINDITNLVSPLLDQAAAFRDQAEANAAASLGAYAASFVGDDRLSGAYQSANGTLGLLQASGAVPSVPGLDFSRTDVNYVFDLTGASEIDITPTVAMVGRIAGSVADTEGALNELGTRIPFSQITDQLKPDALEHFDVSQLFPDLSGLKLDGLFPNAKLPALPANWKDRLSITHGVDSSDQRAWLKAALNLPIANGSVPVADLGPVQVVLSCDRAKPTLTGRAEVAIDAQGHSTTVSEATLSADWQLVIAGTPLVTFTNTQLFLDRGGHLKFQLDPKDIRLAPALQFLTDLMKEFEADIPLKILPLEVGGVPVGVMTKLDIAIPSLQTGAFGVSNLNFGVVFSLSAQPDFELAVETQLGSMFAPFLLNVWILAGAGFVTARTTYVPAKNRAVVSASISLSAGLGMVFNWGPISGGGMLLLGLEADLAWQIGQSASLSLDLYLMARGYVTVLGLLGADLRLLMELAYNNGQAHASGYLSYSIRLGPFASVSVEQAVSYAISQAGNDKSEDRPSEEAE